MNRNRTVRRPALPPLSDRRGSTLVVVIALLGALLLLGMLVLTLASQEEINAEYFADAAKVPQALDEDIYFDFALRQMIVGPDPKFEKQSVLWGARHSLMANLFGKDNQPYTGGGANLCWDTSSSPMVPAPDMDFNGTPDSGNDQILEPNDSIGARGSFPDLQNDYAVPDVDYTSPDINNLFVSYEGMAPTGSPVTSTTKVIIPSFDRPQYLRGIVSGMSTLAMSQWYTNAATKKKVLRPHAEHQAVDDQGNLTSQYRFILRSSDASPELTGPFPFDEDLDGDGMLGTGEDLNGDGVLNSGNPGAFQYGVWSNNGGNYQLDADPDGDGILDAMWMDLGFPAQAAGINEWYVPLFAFKVVELDSLFNLNTHGNLSGNISMMGDDSLHFGGYRYTLTDNEPGNANVDDDGNGVTDDENEVGYGNDQLIVPLDVDDPQNIAFIHRSNLGATPHEVNVQYGLHADLTGLTASDYAQHNLFFERDPANAVELANMEHWFMLVGRADFSGSRSKNNISTRHQGRWMGNLETDRFDEAVDAMTLVPYNFPLPGRSFIAAPNLFNPNLSQHQPYDDNNNGKEGAPFSYGSVNYPGEGHPLDRHGGGRMIKSGTGGRTRLVSTSPNSDPHPHRWARYDKGLIAPGSRYGTLYSTHSGTLSPGATFGYQIDDPTETRIEPSQAQNDQYDSVFGADETAALHLSKNDKSTLNLSGRLDKLMPINFSEADNAETLRRLFTTVSWDLKSHSRAYYGSYTGTADKFRQWEYRTDATVGRELFPPIYTGNPANEPFRQALRDLLTVDPNDTSGNSKPQARLSLNHILDYGPDNRLRFRPLTPHPTGLGNSVARTMGTVPARPENIANVWGQELLARRDRQLLCRDIYVLLYTLCGGNDTRRYLDDNSSRVLYNFVQDSTDSTGIADARGDQCRMMAQFAANVVDQMDPDDVMTVFEYDTNLSDGWGVDDDPYSATGDSAPSGTRQVAYGVEEAQLVLNEAMVVWVKNAGPFNLDVTEWDENMTNRDFLWFELENVSPRQVDFSNEAWQVVVKPPALLTLPNAPSGATATGEERRLTFTNAVPAVRAGSSSMLTVGTQGDEDNKPDGTTVAPSYFRVNPHKNATDTTDTMNMHTLVPRSGSLSTSGMGSLDLIKCGGNMYRVNKAGSGAFNDGTEIPNTTTKAGADLFHIDVTDIDTIVEQDDRQVTIKFEVRRRVNPGRTRPVLPVDSNHDAQSQDNPWVVVDHMEVPLDVFSLTNGADYDEVRAQLKQMTTKERQDPLNGAYSGTHPDSPRTFTALAADPDLNSMMMNSLGLRNMLGQLTNTDKYKLWQPHYDRDFAHAIELFQVPLYPASELTRRLPLKESVTPPSFPAYIPDATNPGELKANVPPGSTSWQAAMTAGYLFMNPDSAEAATGTIQAADFDNRWYRLLEFVEIPSRWHRHGNSPGFNIDAGGVAANPLGIYRVPGKMNLNMLRHPEGLAGLIDDRDVCDLSLGAFTSIPSNTNVNPPLLPDTGRDWWIQFLESRDGYDPTGSNYILPGLPTYLNSTTGARIGGARPFRSLQYSASGVASLQDTVLRSLPMDTGTNPRQLFEIGTQAEHNSGSIDPSVRHRLLGKVMNNSTTRSNAFAVFIQVDFFQAKEVTVGSNKVYRIGAKRADSPSHRGIFIVDRAKAFDLLTQQNLPTTYQEDDGTSRFTYTFNNFDFRSLVLHRQTIR